MTKKTKENQQSQSHFLVERLPLEIKSLTFNNLKKIDHLGKLLDHLNQEMHNVGLSKNVRYTELFKITLCKIFDEIKNKKSQRMDFYIYSGENLPQFYSRIQKMYKEAINYYSQYAPMKLEAEIKLPPRTLFYLVELLQRYSFLKTEYSILQDFFMKFAPFLLKMDLDQYFTPSEVVDFLVDVIKVDKNTYTIDPAGGSGDFLTGIIKKSIDNNIENIKQNIFYWDSSEDAAKVATLNMILHGDCRSNIVVKDSIEDFDSMNGKFSICITNPPFGNQTIWSKSKDLNVIAHYDLGHKWTKNNKTESLIYQQLGILFIERGIKLLKNSGILAIVLPNGYLTNPSESYIRKWLLDNFRIVGVVSLPAGTFKKSGTGVTPVILLVQKTKCAEDYEIFVAVARNIGFDYKDKRTPKIFLREPKSGSYILDNNGNKIPDNDLIEIAKKFKKFAYDNNLENFEKEKLDISYEFISKKEILNDENLVICPKRQESKYKKIISAIKNGGYTTLEKLGAELQNSKSAVVEKSKKYIYLDIAQIGRGSYEKNNVIFGWALPGRAKQSVKKYDILASKLMGSVNKFCMILEDNPRLIATNGVYKIRIADEKERLNFYHFMHTQEYTKQIEALATGSIMEDIKPNDFLNKLLIPTNKKEENFLKMKSLIKAQEQLYNFWDN